MNTKFGTWLFNWRLSQNLSVRALAEVLGVSGAYISALEVGRNVVSKMFLDNLFKIYPDLNTEEIIGFFSYDVQEHKKLKKSRTDLIVWARALATVNDDDQQKRIREVLKQNGIDIPY